MAAIQRFPTRLPILEAEAEAAPEATEAAADFLVPPINWMGAAGAAGAAAEHSLPVLTVLPPPLAREAKSAAQMAVRLLITGAAMLAAPAAVEAVARAAKAALFPVMAVTAARVLMAAPA